MKLYLHLNTATLSTPNLDVKDHTAVYTNHDDDATDTVTVRDLLAEFVSQYTVAHHTPSNSQRLLLTLHDPQNSHSIYTPSHTLDDAQISDRDDLFIKLQLQKPSGKVPNAVLWSDLLSRQQSNGAVSPAPSESTAAAVSDAKPPATANNDTASDLHSETANLKLSTQQPLTPIEAYTLEQLSSARNLQDSGYLRKARDTYQQIVGRVKNTTAEQQKLPRVLSCMQIVYQQLGIIALYNKRYKEAREYFDSALNGVHDIQSPADKHTAQHKLPSLHALLGQSLFGLEHYTDALKQFQTAQKLFNEQPDATKQQREYELLDLRVWQARSMYKFSQSTQNQQAANTYRQKAIEIYEKLMTQDEHHVPTLTYYAAIAVDVGQGTQAIPYLLRAIVDAAQCEKQTPGRIDKNTKVYVEQLLSEVSSTPSGLRALLEQLHSAANSPAALGFLAQTLKDCGNITAATELYERAVVSHKQTANSKTSPDADSNITLNLVHTYEIAYRYQQAFDTIVQWFTTHPDATIASTNVSQPFLDAVSKINDIFDPQLKIGTYNQGYPAYSSGMPEIFDAGITQVTVPASDAEGNLTVTPAVGSISQNGNVGTPYTHNLKPTGRDANGLLAFNHKPYAVDQLNMLALLFTAVKLLYVVGALQPIPKLAQLLEPFRKGKDLHLTIIRNEHAYYSTIIQLVGMLKLPLITDEIDVRSDVIYVVGDSHSLSSAWQQRIVAGKYRLFVPKLVTGLKCWHLRPSSRFYPKRNFEYAMTTIPHNAPIVVFCFGEIDCREGLLFAVEKAKHETLAEGIEHAVKIYLDAVETASSQRSIQHTLIHPIPPVLDVTRPVVKQFVTVIKAKCSERLSMTYLDFYDKLLMPTTNSKGQTVETFNSKYSLDGTHVRSSYTDLLADKIHEAVVATKK